MSSPPVPADGAATDPAPAADDTAGWYTAERPAVHLVRRSVLSRPDSVAGLAHALSRPAGTLVALRMLSSADGRG